jgi:hypothetical protein
MSNTTVSPPPDYPNHVNVFYNRPVEAFRLRKQVAKQVIDNPEPMNAELMSLELVTQPATLE